MPLKSHLVREISRLRISSAEAVENAASFSSLKKYLHVERSIQSKVEDILKKRLNEKGSNLILLCGSVGDGKSHLLAYLNEEKKELMSKFTIINDATESYDPNKTSLETLEELLRDFSDENLKKTNEKIIIAINLGVLHNFVNYEQHKYNFQILNKFINDSGIFTSNIMTHKQDENFDLVSFSDYQMFELTNEGVQAIYLEKLIERVCSENADNPFHSAYKRDQSLKIDSIIHQNYSFLCDSTVRKQIIHLVVKTMIQYNLKLSTRHFLNFIADILMPNNEELIQINSEHTLPNLLFNSQDRSQILNVIQKLKPTHTRSKLIDDLLISLNTHSNIEKLIEAKFSNNIAKTWLLQIDNNGVNKELDSFSEKFISLLYLTDCTFSKNLECNDYREFTKLLYGLNCGNDQVIYEFRKYIKNAIYEWNRYPKSKKAYVYFKQLESDLAIAQNLKLAIDKNIYTKHDEVYLETFKPYLFIAFKKGNKQVTLEINYTLFRLLNKVCKGYRPNKLDENHAATWLDFLEKIMKFGDKQEEILLSFLNEGRHYILKSEDEDALIFEEVE
ncbi:DNA phosphorothioation-dependent restriction protein DptF [Bacillus safensis]|uniref:DNA phosphorothioation-dependent restriction protein DptF n=1 Tax=Bacillus safensis TaxID=561879 RepID=UPI00228202E8|nr:DNA phosphorothioation-dependent restriction protein DptF [Bacillus safensis]MCY7673775.1 DNA phosphorothioation-dependent restriction protein DptF [Bacillus safensis]MCY7696774.1 DNA phosphorothioation-dependent restriction protein DptF [Bacillus safensis]MEC3626329.1 DNA phosphorothioation-dependent restriction protein DptF [Bacillus safensis]